MARQTSIKVGDRFPTNSCGVCIVIKYVSHSEIHVQFKRTKHVCIGRACDIRNGEIKDPTQPSVTGVGFIGVGAYSVKTNPKLYNLWSTMIARCYSEVWQSKHKGYEDCRVTKRWHNFQHFCTDVTQMANWNTPGFELDKDLIVFGNRVYHPKRCCFVPRYVNRFFTRFRIASGFTMKDGKFSVTLNIGGERRYVGRFHTKTEAANAYAKAKQKALRALLDKYADVLDPRAVRSIRLLARGRWQ